MPPKFRIVGKHLRARDEGDAGVCLHELHVMDGPDEPLVGQFWVERTRFAWYETGRRLVDGPFGTFIYSEDKADEIADALIALAANIRKRGRA